MTAKYMTLYDLKHQDYLDLRDLAKLLDTLNDQIEDHGNGEHENEDECPDCNENARELLEALNDLDSQLCGLAEYSDNEPTMIEDFEFRNYAQELAEEIGAIQRNTTWPYNHIDWDAAADELKMDYNEVTFNGTTYQIRSY